MKRIFIALALLLPLPAHAQQTKAALTTEINTNFASGVPGGITAATLRTTTLDILNSIMPTAPVVNNNLVCFDGTTGLLKDCTVVGSPITALTGDVTATGPGSVAATLATVNANVGTFGSSTQIGQFTVNGKGLITAASNQAITPAVSNLTGMGANCGTFLGTPTSANFAACVTGETGTGAVVFGTSPTIATATISGSTISTSSVNGVTLGGNGQYPGTATNDNASAGNIGEYIESVVASGSSVAATSSVPSNITSISVTAGDWTVCGAGVQNPAATTSFTAGGYSLSLVSATLDATYLTFDRFAAFVPANPFGGFAQCRRVSTASTISVFLVQQVTFTVSTTGGYGYLWARRAR